MHVCSQTEFGNKRAKEGERSLGTRQRGQGDDRRLFENIFQVAECHRFEVSSLAKATSVNKRRGHARTRSDKP